MGHDGAGQRADEPAAAGPMTDVERSLAALSTAVRELTAAGDVRRAALTCAQLGDVYANGLGNPIAARVWFARGRRLLADEPPCLEQGWVAVAAMGCDVDDPAVLRDAAELALDRARRFGDVNLETKALADAGLALVQLGRIDDGMAMLDEAMALACGPADDASASARSVCSFFTACYHAADFGRAETWVAMLRRRGLVGEVAGEPVFLSSHCALVRAASLVELGRWTEAEQVLVRARETFRSLMPVPSWHPDIGLADLRVRQGRIAEAEALLVHKEQSLEALLPAARVQLAKGDHDLAAAMARRGLRAIGADRLRAVTLLGVLVEAELARGDVGAARDASARLTTIAGATAVVALQARAARPNARLLATTGDPGGAIALLERTIDLLASADLPYLTATVLLQLAAIRADAGDVVGARIDARLAAQVLSRLDVVLDAEQQATLARLTGGADRRGPTTAAVATLARTRRGWLATAGGTSVALADTKGVRYLAVLLERPGCERHALDLVDRIEGLAPAGGPDRRSLAGSTGAALDTHARVAYRRRIEALRSRADEALRRGRDDEAGACHDEIDQLVRQLAQAFGLAGRARPVGSAAERARLNVTRALRAAIASIARALPEAAAVLDRDVRTGSFCRYEPEPGALRWTVDGGPVDRSARTERNPAG